MYGYSFQLLIEHCLVCCFVSPARLESKRKDYGHISHLPRKPRGSEVLLTWVMFMLM